MNIFNSSSKSAGLESADRFTSAIGCRSPGHSSLSSLDLFFIRSCHEICGRSGTATGAIYVHQGHGRCKYCGIWLVPTLVLSDCLKLRVLKVFRYPQKFVAAALIGGDIDGGHYMPSPSRRCDSQTTLQCRVKQFCDRRLLC